MKQSGDPHPLSPRLDTVPSRLAPRLPTQFFHDFQWFLDDQEPDNPTVLVSSQAWGPPNHFRHSHASHFASLPPEGVFVLPYGLAPTPAVWNKYSQTPHIPPPQVALLPVAEYTHRITTKLALYAFQRFAVAVQSQESTEAG